MRCLISDTGAHKYLSIITEDSGIDWSRDALCVGERDDMTWDGDYYVMSSATYDEAREYLQSLEDDNN